MFPSIPPSLRLSVPSYLIQDSEEGTEARSYNTPENMTIGAVRTGTEGGRKRGREGGREGGRVKRSGCGCARAIDGANGLKEEEREGGREGGSTYRASSRWRGRVRSRLAPRPWTWRLEP